MVKKKNGVGLLRHRYVLNLVGAKFCVLCDMFTHDTPDVFLMTSTAVFRLLASDGLCIATLVAPKYFLHRVFVASRSAHSNHLLSNRIVSKIPERYTAMSILIGMRYTFQFADDDIHTMTSRANA